MFRTEWQPKRRWENKPVVRELDDRLMRWLMRMCVGLLIAIAPTGIYLWINNNSIALAKESNNRTLQLEQRVELERELQAELAAKENLASIEAWALQDLGLVRPASDQIDVLPSTLSDSGSLMARAPDEGGK